MPAKSGGGRPKKYRTSTGEVVPGTTTITGRFKDSGGIIHWAWRQGMDGIDYRAAKDAAAAAGTYAHALIDHSLVSDNRAETTGPIAPADVGTTSKALNAFAQFLEWRSSTNLEILETELPIVSDVHRYGGTLDAVGTLNGKVALIDWKSSNGVYADYLAQMGAYRILWDERFPDRPIERVHLLRVDKEAESFVHHSWGLDVIDKASKAFLLMRALFDYDAPLKRAAG